MKSLILVAVILHLVITVVENNGQYQFGDIIAFPRRCLYKHYAIYVGPQTTELDIGQGDNDIFHRTGKRTNKKPGCGFGLLNKTRGTLGDKKENYLDDLTNDTSRSKEQIIQRINESIHDCGKYRVFANNCEHLATFVRYGVSLSLQNGTVAACFLKKNTQKVEDMQNRMIKVRANDSSSIEETLDTEHHCDNDPN